MTEQDKPSTDVSDANATEAASSADPSGNAALEESKNDIVGVMAAASSWVVPFWIKAAWFWLAVVTLGGLSYEQISKRATFRHLLVDSVVEPEAPTSGMAAPDFTLPPGPQGDAVALAGLKGKWVLVNFWATWCPPCRDEMPSLEMLQRRLTRDAPGKLEMLAVSVDENWAEVNRFFGSTQPTFRVLWDREKTASAAYGSRKFPETYLIAPDGTVAAKFTGPRDWYNQGMVQYFTEVLAGSRKPVS